MDKHWLIKSLEKLTLKKTFAMLALIFFVVTVGKRDSGTTSFIPSEQFYRLIENNPQEALNLAEQFCQKNNLVLRSDILSYSNIVTYRISTPDKGRDVALIGIEFPTAQDPEVKVVLYDTSNGIPQYVEGCGLSIGTIQYIVEYLQANHPEFMRTTITQ